MPRHVSGTRTKLRRHRSSSAKVRLNRDSTSLQNIFEQNNNKSSPTIVDNFQHEELPFRTTIDAEVKSLMKRRSKMSQSIDNIKIAFSNFSTKSPKVNKKLKEKRANSMVIII